MSDTNSLDDILSALAVSNIPSTPPPSKIAQPTEYDERQELLKTIGDLDELIRTNAKVLDEARRLVESTGDAEYFEAYSSIGKAQSEAIKNKVKILTDKEKTKIMKETKDRELDIKDKLAEYTIGNNPTGGGPTTLNQTNNVIMSSSREDMYEMIVRMKAHEKVSTEDIEAEIIE